MMGRSKWFAFSILVNLLAVMSPASLANTDQQKMLDQLNQLDQLDQLDHLDFLDQVDKANACIKSRQFGCAEKGIAEAAKSVANSKDKDALLLVKQGLVAERQRVADEEKAEQERLLAEKETREAEERQRIAQQKSTNSGGLGMMFGAAALTVGGLAVMDGLDGNAVSAIAQSAVDVAGKATGTQPIGATGIITSNKPLPSSGGDITSLLAPVTTFAKDGSSKIVMPDGSTKAVTPSATSVASTAIASDAIPNNEATQQVASGISNAQLSEYDSKMDEARAAAAGNPELLKILDDANASMNKVREQPTQQPVDSSSKSFNSYSQPVVTVPEWPQTCPKGSSPMKHSNGMNIAVAPGAICVKDDQGSSGQDSSDSTSSSDQRQSSASNNAAASGNSNRHPSANNANAVTGPEQLEAVAVCWQNSKNAEFWRCDGPVQDTILSDEHLEKQLELAGCENPRLTDGDRTIKNRRATVYLCGFGLMPYEADVSKTYGITVQRNKYQCSGGKYETSKCKENAQMTN